MLGLHYKMDHILFRVVWIVNKNFPFVVTGKDIERTGIHQLRMSRNMVVCLRASRCGGIIGNELINHSYLLLREVQYHDE